jgi:hypothetical protein
MWVILLILVAAVSGFLLGLRRGKMIATQEAFEAGKKAALAQKKQLIRAAFSLGLQRGINESRAVKAEHTEHI